jgi:Bacterial Ig-like domain (group 3)
MLVRLISSASVALVSGVLVFSAPAGAATGGALPEFNLLGKAGNSSNLTVYKTMDMKTGAFTGRAVIDGETFKVRGTEHGNTIHATYTWTAETSYKSYNVDHLRVRANGKVGGPGSFHDTNGTQETYTYYLNRPTGTRASTLALHCPKAGARYDCRVAVTGAKHKPTGNVTFTAAHGSFTHQGACQLSSGKCSLVYTAPSRGKRPAITATYSADATYRVSRATLK